MTAPAIFRYPNPMNEVSARLVAGGVAVLCVLTLALDWPWLMVVLAYGFVARALTGPRLSPLAQFVNRALVPRLGIAPKWVAGPPKRFAQGIGAALSVAAVVVHFGFGLAGAAGVLVALILVAALLESVLAFCIGCQIFGLLMRWGLVPTEVCERCENIWGSAADGARRPHAS